MCTGGGSPKLSRNADRCRVPPDQWLATEPAAGLNDRARFCRPLIALCPDRRLAVLCSNTSGWTNCLATASDDCHGLTLLVGLRTPEPKSSKEADDHNTGVDMLRSLHAYLKTQSRRSRKFFNSVVHDARVVQLLDESISTVSRWHEDRSSDRTVFDRMKLIHSREFARSESNKLRDLLGPPDDHRRSLQ